VIPASLKPAGPHWAAGDLTKSKCRGRSKRKCALGGLELTSESGVREFAQP
jgi:hypothetical protein